MNILLALALISTAIPFLVYVIYIVASISSRPPISPSLQILPKVSIVIPAYNEESVIEGRINNIASIYPKDKMEVIISNDGSADRTEEVAKKALDENSLHGEVITHQRSGVNKAINRGVQESSNEIIVITGADGLFGEHTIHELVRVLLSSDDIGAVSGDMTPLSEHDTVFFNSEKAYRSVYGKICMWESNVHSTYCLNGAIVAYKKKAASVLNTRKGADDASMALSVIRNGYKCKYVPTARFYEPVPHEFSEQRRQKIRRATRLLEATFFNRDVMSPKYGKFGTIVFPLRILMFFVVPALFLLSILLWAVILAYVNILYAVAFIGLLFVAVLLGNVWTNVLSSFIIYQVYLFLGLFNMLRDVHVWEPGSRGKQ
jgi:cellulose synthase/poly-beta-1,6-N-acetylglucosamine synthase-like glycosyltransferase